MPSWSSLDAFGADVKKMVRDLERKEAKRITREMAEKAQQIAEAAASRDLGGDPKFSGWAPTLDTQIKPSRDGLGHVIMPTRSSAGPWTVAEFGRNQGNASGFAGPGINRSTGLTARTKSGGIRRQRMRKAKRWNGVTRGKGTASDAVSRMDRELPRIAEREVRRVIARQFDVR